MAKKIASFFAVLALAMLVGACSKGSPTSPTGPGNDGTPTPTEIKSLEFRPDSGLGNPYATPLPNPVTVEMRLQLLMTFTVNTGRKPISSSLKVYLGEKLVRESVSGPGEDYRAGTNGTGMTFDPQVPGLYTAIGEVSDNLGSSTMQVSLTVVPTPGTDYGTPRWSEIKEVKVNPPTMPGTATWFTARIFVHEGGLRGLSQTQQWLFRDANGVETEARRTEVTTLYSEALTIAYEGALPTKPGVYKMVIRLTESWSWNGQSNTSEKSVDFTVP